MKIGILIINLGTPDAPTPSAVGRYLREFLGDKRVIDIPWLGRKILVNGIIAPTRKYKSSKEYKKVWTADGSPLLLYTQELAKKLGERFQNEDIHVEMAMRYGSPSMASVLQKMETDRYDKVIVLPLYPQYASASTGSTLEETFRLISKWYVIPEIVAISQFWDHPGYLSALENSANGIDLKAYDHILMSYHGLPERQVDKVYEDKMCSNHACETEINEENRFCYVATCYATSRAIASRLGINEDEYTVCFQSRLDQKWVRPFSDEVIVEMAKAGKKKLLVFSPAFVADCLETIVEIGEGYLELFQENGGEDLKLVPSLNTSSIWVDALEQMLRERIK
ncbi:MAG: ferrochelatase [Cryomorphaceae bacterium]|nr:ferrochelatase [Cryomorphaceae bacterium]